MDFNKTVCKNCGNAFAGNYCSNCGQKAGTFRITFKELINHIPHAVFHIDHGFLYTGKELATRPGHTIREYLQGKRKSHFNPFLMLLLVGGFCSYLYGWFHFQTVIASISIAKLESQSAAIAHKFFAYRTFFFCLICSIGDYLVFFDKKYSLAEMVVANAFMFCGVLVIQLLFFPVLLWGRYLDAERLVALLLVIIAMVYLALARVQLFKAGGSMVQSGKIVLALLAYLSVIFITGRFVVHPLLSR